MENKFIAFLIDPFKKECFEVECDENIEIIHSLIESDYFDIATINNQGDGVVVDDLGLFKPNQCFFMIYGYEYRLGGKGLVIGCDLRTGDTKKPFITFEELKHSVVWLE